MIVKKAYKCYIEDEKGDKLIDTTMGSGAQIIGHNNPLIRKIAKQIKKGTIYTIPNCHTNTVNSYLKKYINPDLHEEYIFCNSGTEANMRAIRLARAFTGKSNWIYTLGFGRRRDSGGDRRSRGKTAEDPCQTGC